MKTLFKQPLLSLVFACMCLSACVSNSQIQIDESAIKVLPKEAAIEYLQGIQQRFSGSCAFDKSWAFPNVHSGKISGPHSYADISFAAYESFGSRSIILWVNKDGKFTNKQRIQGDYCQLIWYLSGPELAAAINDKVFENTVAALVSLGARRVAVTI